MDAQELINILKEFPPTMEVWIKKSENDFEFSLADKVERKEIPMKEDPDGEELAREEVVVISDFE